MRLMVLVSHTNLCTVKIYGVPWKLVLVVNRYCKSAASIFDQYDKLPRFLKISN